MLFSGNPSHVSCQIHTSDLITLLLHKPEATQPLISEMLLICGFFVLAVGISPVPFVGFYLLIDC